VPLGDRIYPTETALEQILTSSYKAGMISYLAAHPEDFEEAASGKSSG